MVFFNKQKKYFFWKGNNINTIYLKISSEIEFLIKQKFTNNLIINFTESRKSNNFIRHENEYCTYF